MDDDGHKHLGQTVAQAVALAGSISIFLSAIHEAGFFAGLGSRLYDIPISVSDILAQALVWLPTTVVIVYVALIVALAIPERKPKRVTKLRNKLIIVCAALAFVVTITFFVPGPHRFLVLTITIVLPLLLLMARALSNIGINNDRIFILGASALVAPILVFLMSYQDGAGTLKTAPRTDRIVLLSGATVDNIEIVRNYAGGVLYLSDDSRIYFQERSNIALTATSLRASQWNGLVPEHIRNRIPGLPAPPQ